MLSVMVCFDEKYFPDLVDQVSQELTPMVATARTIKQEHPNAKVVFIGPCASKKLEASRRTSRSDVDFVITFEELQVLCLMQKELIWKNLRRSLHSMMQPEQDADMRLAGGVAAAIEKCINEYYPDVDVNIEHAEGLQNARECLSCKSR